MATNKHAIIRYQTLDKCFRNPGRRYFIDDLIAECNKSIYEFTGKNEGVQRRQIFEDIKFMKSEQGWSVPLEHFRDGHKVYYRYGNKSFSINNQPLNETEENQLKEALLTLSRFKGMPQFEWVDEITARLDSGLDLSHNQNKIIEFEQNQYLKGLEHITPLYYSILYKKALAIQYRSFKQDTDQLINFHSYYLKQYNNRWYVFGKDESNGYIINLALDRIVSVNEIDLKYKPNSLIDFSEYFEDIIGVTFDNERKAEIITLKISNSLYPYVQTKPIHGSQKVVERAESHTVINIEVIPNYELESLVLSYGEGLEILLPHSLRNRIQHRIELILKKYHDS